MFVIHECMLCGCYCGCKGRFASPHPPFIPFIPCFVMPPFKGKDKGDDISPHPPFKNLIMVRLFLWRLVLRVDFLFLLEKENRENSFFKLFIIHIAYIIILLDNCSLVVSVSVDFSFSSI